MTTPGINDKLFPYNDCRIIRHTIRDSRYQRCASLSCDVFEEGE